MSFFKCHTYTNPQSQNGKQMVQEGALTALASVADTSQVGRFISTMLFLVAFLLFSPNFCVILQEQFQKYYDTVMPYLKAILVNATDKSNRMLRAKSMECISLVGMAVGKEKFRDDAKQVIFTFISFCCIGFKF